jgi:hypothetical protein
MTLPPDTSDASLDRIEVLVDQTRQKVLQDLEQILLRQLDPIQEGIRRALLTSTETILHQQIEPILQQTRTQLAQSLEELARRQVEPVLARTHEMILKLAAEIVERHATPLVNQVRVALQNALEQVVQQQMGPMLERARHSLQESTQLAGQFADAVVSRLKVTVGEPTKEVLREQVPEYAHWAGRRAMDYVLAAGLFCLAAVFLLVGGVLGLQAVGVPPFATYLIGGLAALGGGLMVMRLFSPGPPLQAKKDDGPSKT